MVINVFNELLRHEHVVVLERLPLFLDRIKGRVEHDAMTVQMRVERARGVMPENGRYYVARGPVGTLAVLPNTCGRQRLQLVQRRRDRPVMCLDDSRIIANQCRNGNRFWRGEGKVVEDTPIGALVFLAILPDLHPSGFVPQRQPFAGLRMKVLA